MKKSFCKLIKDYLRVSFLQTRDALHLTQEQMADRLLMSTRAYAKLEAGHSCCSLFTALIFLSAAVPIAGPFWKAYSSFSILSIFLRADFSLFSNLFPAADFFFLCSFISYTLF